MSDRKKLVAVFRMPERATSAERIAHAQEDVQDATAKLRAELTNKATTLHTGGYTLDEDSWEFAANGRLIIGTVVVGR